MNYPANSPEEYLSQLPPERKEALGKLRKVIQQNIPKGFEETMSYGMIGYVVPHSLYPAGYHCDPRLPLPFLSIASQKNFIALYHMGVYMDEKLMSWWVNEYPKHSKSKLDMGKSCIRFKNIHEIPYDLIAEFVGKLSVGDVIRLYETNIKR